MSELALKAGIIDSGLISSAGIDCPLFAYSFAYVFQLPQGNFLPLLGCAYFLFGYVLLIRDLRRAYPGGAAAGVAANAADAIADAPGAAPAGETD